MFNIKFNTCNESISNINAGIVFSDFYLPPPLL
nr:MAG TPA: hypothetical protein [Crassvirales sp.]